MVKAQHRGDTATRLDNELKATSMLAAGLRHSSGKHSFVDDFPDHSGVLSFFRRAIRAWSSALGSL